jgi:cystathionine gamma-synthase
VDGCKLAKIAPSLGGVETLIEQPAIMSYFELDEKQLEAVGISSSLIRLSVGIEDQKDVIEDVLGSLDGA